jgi:hypothetical protein
MPVLHVSGELGDGRGLAHAIHAHHHHGGHWIMVPQPLDLGAAKQLD